MTQRLGGTFETFNDPMGNPLISLNRDGTINTLGLDFADGTVQTSAGSASNAALNFSQTVPGLTMAKIHSENLGSGDNDVYTVPTGKRAIAAFQIFNTAGTTTTFYPEVKIGGIYYRTTSNSALNTLVAASSGWLGFVLEAGQSFAFNATQAGLNVFGSVYLFPNTSTLKTKFLTSLASGDNTLYTCPAGKTANIAFGNALLTGTSAGGIVPLANTSGGSLNYFYNVVSSGGSPSTANKAVPTTAVTNNTITTFSTVGNFTLTAGDYISVNASGPSAGLCWMTVQELSADS